MTPTDADAFNLIISKIQTQEKNGDVAMALTVDMMKGFMGEYLEKLTKNVQVKDTENSEKTHEVKVLELTTDQQLINQTHLKYFIDILTSKHKVYDLLVIKNVAEFLSVLSRYELYRNMFINEGMVMDTINGLINTNHTMTAASFFKLLNNLCFNSIEAQNQLVNSGELDKILIKFVQISQDITIGKLFDEQDTIEANAATDSMKHLVADNVVLRQKLVERNAIELLSDIVMKHLNTNPLFVLECSALLHWLIILDNGKERAIPSLLNVFTAMDFNTIFDDELLREKLILQCSTLNEQQPPSTCTSTSEDNRLQVFRQSLIDAYIAIFGLIEQLIQDPKTSKILFEGNGFEFCYNLINKYTSNPFDDKLLAKICDICVLITLNDDVGDAIFNNQKQMEDIKQLLTNDNYCISSSAALILGNLCRCATRSEYFVEHNYHSIVINNMLKILQKATDISKNVDFILADISCLKNFLVPVKCRQNAIAPSNIDDTIRCFEQIFLQDNKLLVVKAYVVLRMIISCNAAGICKKILDSSSIMDCIKKDSLVNGSALGVNIESLRILLTLAVHCDTELITTEIFNKEFFEAIITNNARPNNQLFIDFSNIFNVIVSKKHLDIIPIVADSGILSNLKNALVEGKNGVPFPFLVSTITTFLLALRTGSKDIFLAQIKGQDLIAIIEFYTKLNNPIVTQLTTQLTNILNEC